MSSREELEAAIEAILFVATEPVATERLYALFAEDDRETVDAALQSVIARYPGDAAQGLVADFAAGGVRLVTRPALQGYLRKFFQVTGRTKLSMAALETLAIVAYRQPITGPEIQELRGVSTAGVLKTLLDHRLVRISGRKEVVGKPFLYSTSREFLVRFGLNRLQDLPPLEELEQMLQSQAEIEDGQSEPQPAIEFNFGVDPGERAVDDEPVGEDPHQAAPDDGREGVDSVENDRHASIEDELAGAIDDEIESSIEDDLDDDDESSFATFDDVDELDDDELTEEG
jgi:segregation and condensation protein B